jgi:hypothetical protein
VSCTGIAPSSRFLKKSYPPWATGRTSHEAIRPPDIQKHRRERMEIKLRPFTIDKKRKRHYLSEDDPRYKLLNKPFDVMPIIKKGFEMRGKNEG